MFLKIRIAAALLPLGCLLSFCATTKNQPVADVPIADTTVKLKSPLPGDSSKTDAFFLDLFKQYPAYFDSILANRKNWNVQLIYTRVDRGANGMPALKNYYFNLDAKKYFYPASTVKFPVSILALQKLDELNIERLDKNATMITGQDYSGQTSVYNDPTTPDGKPTIEQYIKKILLVSDNDAFNRLYEFLGPAYINSQLHAKGYPDAQIIHRLERTLSPDENRHTNPVKFYNALGEVIYDQPMKVDTTVYEQRNDSMGNAYYKGPDLISGPMDFSKKNRISLEDLHNILISLVFPAKVPASQRFNITAEDRNFLLKYMSQLPTESQSPPYAADTTTYFPAYCKFLLFGSEKGALPKNIRSFNKVGDAYGQVIDVAYIVDFDKKVEFFLSAAMYCNSDGVLNDDKYDNDSIGLPFMKHLGEVIYQQELKRERKYPPDLKELIFEDEPVH